MLSANSVWMSRTSFVYVSSAPMIADVCASIWCRFSAVAPVCARISFIWSAFPCCSWYAWSIVYAICEKEPLSDLFISAMKLCTTWFRASTWLRVAMFPKSCSVLSNRSNWGFSRFESSSDSCTPTVFASRPIALVCCC